MSICLLVIGGLLSGCDRQHELPGYPNDKEAQELIWSYLVNDYAQEPRINKWVKSELRGLMIVDAARTRFYDLFSPLTQQVGQKIDMKIEFCEAVVSEAAVTPTIQSCSGTDFDFYFVVTNGNWTSQQWGQAGHFFSDRTAKLLSKLQVQVPAAEANPCRYALATSMQSPGQMEAAITIVDSGEPIVAARCSADSFMETLGLFPYDGMQPLDVSREANSVAEFMLKEAPYGGTFLLRLLYAPTVRPGMNKAEFMQTLPNN